MWLVRVFCTICVITSGSCRPRGVPQIDVTFDIDANGILNVTACEKSTGNEKKITIKNDRDRLSAEDIERLVQEAERHRVEDEHIRGRSEALTMLESYVLHNMHTLNADAVKNLMTPEQLKRANDALAAEKTWLEENKATAEKEEFDLHLTGIKDILIPIVQGFAHHEPPGAQPAAEAAPAAKAQPASPVDAEAAFQQGEDH